MPWPDIRSFELRGSGGSGHGGDGGGGHGGYGGPGAGDGDPGGMAGRGPGDAHDNERCGRCRTELVALSDVLTAGRCMGQLEKTIDGGLPRNR
ncbi:hypothetical protein D0O09_10995 [Pseudomonas putida]|nr:hypothetical protein D0O09_10995 [Pseudomonas putida]